MSHPSPIIETQQKEMRNQMSVTIKRNLILVALSVVGYLMAGAGFKGLSNDTDFFAPFLAIIGTMLFLGFTIGLIIRLWGNEKE